MTLLDTVTVIDLIIIFMTNEDSVLFFTIYGTVNNLHISSTGRKKRGSGFILDTKYKSVTDVPLFLLATKPDTAGSLRSGKGAQKRLRIKSVMSNHRHSGQTM